MTILQQNPTAIDDCSELTISLWFKVAGLADGDSILQFGDVFNRESSISLKTDGTINAQFLGPAYVDTVTSSTTSQQLHFQASGFLLDTWNHFFLSVSLAPGINGASMGFGPLGGDEYNTAYCYVNNASTLDYLDAPFGSVAAQGGETGGDPGDATAGIVVGGTVFTPGGPSCVGLPFIDSEFIEANSSIFRFAYVQIWFGKFIDPTNPGNLSKFFTRKTIKGVPRLVPPTDIQAAQKAFGPSDIWCYRDKKTKIQFQVNHGTGGPFTVVGSSPADYTPGPGQ